MERFERETAKHYHNKNTHISIYPVVVVTPAVYRLNLISAFTQDNGKTWRKQQTFTGEDESLPLRTWEDVILYVDLELKRLSSIIEPLLNDDICKAWNNFANINGFQDYLTLTLKNINQEKERYVERYINQEKEQLCFEPKIKQMCMYNPNDDPRMELKHWLPIWTAWKHFSELLQKDLENGILIQLD